MKATITFNETDPGETLTLVRALGVYMATIKSLPLGDSDGGDAVVEMATVEAEARRAQMIIKRIVRAVR